MKRRYFVIDIEKCIGCFNCLHACKDEHVGNNWLPVTLPQKLHEQYWLTTKEKVRGQHPMIDVAYLTEPCGHCEEALCVQKGNGAVYRREDGVVLIDQSKATGDLSKLCPFGKISWNEEQGVSQKCTFCAHLLDEGWEQPRCAQACPLGALQMRYEEREDMEKYIKQEGLEQLDFAHAAAKSAVWYKNLYRYTSLFAGGTVVKFEKGREICFEGCLVVLYKNGIPVAQTETDPYGDFKFDRLNPGKYELSVCPKGYRANKMEFEINESRYLGVFRM